MKRTILLVDDEALIRGVIREMLVMLGHRVLEAGTGQEALSVWGENCDSIDLLITDVVMPEMSGPEVAARINAQRPGLHVVYISGYAESDIGHLGVNSSRAVLLSKPFTFQALAQKLRELESPPGP